LITDLIVMSQENLYVHLFAGGFAGTTAAVITCPLEVVKTRLQSSVANFSHANNVVQSQTQYNLPKNSVNFAQFTTATSTQTVETLARQTKPPPNLGLVWCIRHILQQEGHRGLFKGLGPNLIGVAPSRAIYFFAYANAKQFLNSVENGVLKPDTPLVHIMSAFCAGFTASTATNPIWFIKTRVQLDQKRQGSLTAYKCFKRVYQTDGIRGFYKGITASYYGIAETVIHFVIYEAIKAHLREVMGSKHYDSERNYSDFLLFMAAGATSKTIATCVAYPHEVARTRLRQEGSKYHGFWQTLRLVLREEGLPGVYRGLCTQLVRQIPNTAIMMSTYELVVYLCNTNLYYVN
jgi:solute carrier family 25 protein 33/36